MLLVIVLVLSALATWRISHVLLRENGPFELLRNARIKLGVVYHRDANDAVVRYKFEITTCIWCLSMWVGAVCAWLLWLAMPDLPLVLFLTLPYAYSALAVILDTHYGLK